MAKEHIHPFDEFCAKFGRERNKNAETTFRLRGREKPEEGYIDVLMTCADTLVLQVQREQPERGYQSVAIVARRPFETGPYMMEWQLSGAANCYGMNWAGLCNHIDKEQGFAKLRPVKALMSQVYGVPMYAEAFRVDEMKAAAA